MSTPQTITELVVITPEIAAQMLRDYEYPYQRTVRQHRVEYYAEEMRRGQFLADTQLRVAVLGDKRHLVDGQHRLLALIKANKPVRFNMLTKVCAADQEVAEEYNLTDRGLPRTAADQYRVLGYERRFNLTSTQVNSLGAAVSLIHNQLISTQQAKIHYEDKQFLLEAFGDAAHLYFEAIRYGAAEMATPLKRSSSVALGVITFEFAVKSLGESVVLDYWEGIATDDGLKKGDPRKVANTHLRNTVLSGGGTTSRSSRMITPAHSIRYLINTFNRWVKGETYKGGTGSGSKVYESLERQPVTILGTPWRGTEIDVVNMMKKWVVERNPQL